MFPFPIETIFIFLSKYILYNYNYIIISTYLPILSFTINLHPSILIGILDTAHASLVVTSPR